MDITEKKEKAQDEEVESASNDGVKLSVLHSKSSWSIFKKLMKLSNSKYKESIIKDGVNLANYCLVCADQKTEVEVYLKIKQGTGFLRLGKGFKDNEAANKYAHQFCNAVIRLNMKWEGGLHIVEHILLRPRGNASFENNFDYNFRVSVIFPSWTARFSDQEFRKYAQEMVQRNLPAHVFPYFYWLDFEDMQEFEKRYCIWLRHMQQVNQENGDNILLNSASKEIKSFLLEKRQRNEFGYWV